MLLGALAAAGRGGMGHDGLPRATNLLPPHVLVMEPEGISSTTGIPVLRMGGTPCPGGVCVGSSDAEMQL